MPPRDKPAAIQKNFVNFSFRKKYENKITTTGAKLDKKVALDTVVNFMDQCQQIKSKAKNNPEKKKTK